MAFKTMYPAVAGSPTTTTGNTFVAGTTAELTVSQGSVLAAAPNLATITAADGRFVTVSYTSKSGNTISGLTALEGDTTGTFAIGSIIARRYSAVDDSAIKDNIIDIISDATKEEYYNVYVTTSGSDTTGDGTQAKPWRTVQKAITTINNLNKSVDTYRINIASGDYNFTQREIQITRNLEFLITGNVAFNLSIPATYANMFQVLRGVGISIVGSASTDTLTLSYTGGGTSSEQYAFLFRQGSLYLTNVNLIINFVQGIIFQNARSPTRIKSLNKLIISSSSKITVVSGQVSMNLGIINAAGEITYGSGSSHRVLSVSGATLAICSSITGTYSVDNSSVLAIGGKWINQA